MVMNMLNHNTAKVKNLENSLTSLIKQLRAMKDTMNKRIGEVQKKVTSIEKAVVGVDVSIESQGCEDPFVPVPKSCGKSTIFVNGIDKSLHGRGYNFVVVDEISGKFESAAAFDTCGDDKASNNMVRYIDNIKDGKIVLVAIQDDGFNRLTDEGKTALESLGAINPGAIEFRGSFAFVGVKGKVRRNWVWQVLNTKGKGPSKLKASIPLLRD